MEAARRRGLIEQLRHHEFRKALEDVAKMARGLINGQDKRKT